MSSYSGDKNCEKKIYIIRFCFFCFSSTSEMCNVHYVHPTSTAIPTTCCTCVTSQSFQLEVNNTLSSTICCTVL